MTILLQLFVNGLLIGVIYSVAGVIVTIVYKSTHVVSMAHGQLLAFGALLFWIFIDKLTYPIWLSLALSMIIMSILAYVIEHFTMRPLIGQSLFSAFLMTFCVFTFLDGIFALYLAGHSFAYPTFVEGVLQFGGVALSKIQLVCFLTCLLVFLGLALFFKYTELGLGMRAAAEGHQLAQSAGVRVKNIFTFVWIISSIIAVIGGIGVANVASISYGLPYIGIKGLIVALFGGLESIGGSLLAGLILGMFEIVSGYYFDPITGGGVRDASAYVLLLFILLVRPYGLFGLHRIERI